MALKFVGTDYSPPLRQQRYKRANCDVGSLEESLIDLDPDFGGKTQEAQSCRRPRYSCHAKADEGGGSLER